MFRWDNSTVLQSYISACLLGGWLCNSGVEHLNTDNLNLSVFIILLCLH